MTDDAILTAKIIAAYVMNHHVPLADLQSLIAATHQTVLGLDDIRSDGPAEMPVEKPTAAQIRNSVTDDGIISFLDGKPYKSLKRHLTANGLDPRSYRERYGLPVNYPMVAPAYAAQRSALAKRLGLGRPGALAEKAVAQSLAA